MPRIARVRAPDGRVMRVRVPDGATPEQIKSFVASKMNAQSAPKRDRGILGTIKDVAGGFVDSATLGTADEIGAAIDTVTGLRSGGRDYEANLRNRRQAADEAGGGRLAGQVIGGVALPMGKAAAAAKGLKGVAATAGIGAGYGAAYEAGSADGGIADRAKAVPAGLALGAGGGVAGRAVGNVAGRALRGKVVPKEAGAAQDKAKAIRLLDGEGVVMTPGRRGGKVARTYEESLLGSIPFVKDVPQAANRRSVEQFNLAAYNRTLKPLGITLPKSTAPGKQALTEVGDVIHGAYDDATSRLSLGLDSQLTAAGRAIAGGAKRTVGKDADQLTAIVNDTIGTLKAGPIAGQRVRDVLQDLRGKASSFAKSPVAAERNMGAELWRLHDGVEEALMRQNKGDVLKPFKDARESVKLLMRVEDAASKATDGSGLFNPNQFRQAVTKRGYGVTTGKVARHEAPMQDLAEAAKMVLPATVPNSGSPERAAALATLSGPGAYAFIDPTLGLGVGASLGRYAPGVDRALQNFSLNRPDLLRRGGNALYDFSPYLAPAGAITAVDQGR